MSIIDEIHDGIICQECQQPLLSTVGYAIKCISCGGTAHLLDPTSWIDDEDSELEDPIDDDEESWDDDDPDDLDSTDSDW